MSSILPRPALGSALAALLCVGLWAAPAAAIDVGGRAAILGWSPTTGPVAGYAVFVDHGSGFSDVPERLTLPGSTQATIVANYGERLRLQVAAFDAQGNFGPRSLPSAWIRFVESGEASPGGLPLPEGDSGAGALLEFRDQGGVQVASCGEPPIVEGSEFIKARLPGHDPRDETPIAAALAYCDGEWALTTDQGLTLSGSYARRPGRDRKLLLYLDGPSEQALLGGLALRASSLAGRAIDPRVGKPTYLRLRVRDADAKLKAIIKLRDPSGDELARYKLNTTADLSD